MNIRYRNLRKTEIIREMIAETIISPAQLILPLFVSEGTEETEISSMPGVFRFGLEKVYGEIESLLSLNIKTILLFSKLENSKKDNVCS